MKINIKNHLTNAVKYCKLQRENMDVKTKRIKMDDLQITELAVKIAIALHIQNKPKNIDLIKSEIADYESSRVELPVILPSIQIDKDALRFEFEDGGKNLFWEDLFVGQRTANFQADIMRNLFKAYNEIITRSN